MNFLVCHRKYISCAKKYSSFCSLLFLWQETSVLSQENSFCDRYHNPFIISCILPVTGSFSFDMDIFHVTTIVPPITRRTVCVIWSIFPFALSQEIYSCETKKLIFSCDTRCTSCNKICSSSGIGYSFYVYQQYFLCHKNYFSCDRE